MPQAPAISRLAKHQSNIVNRELDFAYIAIAKASNTTVRHGLLGALGLNSDDTFNGRPVKEIIHRQDGGPFNYEPLSTLFKKPTSLIFTVVRNPWSRIMSCYRDKFLYKFHEPFREYGMRPDYSFSDFVEHISRIPDRDAEIHFRSQRTQIFFEGSLVPNLILRTETLSEDWRLVQSYFEGKHGISLRNLGRFAAREGSTKSFTVSQNDIDIISKRYEGDVKLFGYSLPEGIPT